MMSARDFTGLYAIIPTPAAPGAEHLGATQTVALDETERLVESLIADGVSGLLALGTTGECATLSSSDYRTFVNCLLRVVDRRVPTLVGTTALGGHEVAARTEYVREHGADGILLGLPMWQPLSTEMAVDFYRQMSSTFPDVAIIVYANSRAFRYTFPLEFWSALAAQAPTVVAAKYSRPKNLPALLAAVSGRIHILPNEMTAASFFASAPDTTAACWATAAAMGPAPVIALMDAIAAGDAGLVTLIDAEIAAANEPLEEIFGDPEIFASYNIQVEKARINAAGYCSCGPCRPPYNHLPADYAAAARECGQRWQRLNERYTRAGRPYVLPALQAPAPAD